MNSAVKLAPLRTSCLVELGTWLRSVGYSFITPTPATHQRVNSRVSAAQAHDLRDVFGWSRPFDPRLLPANVLASMQSAQLLHQLDSGELRSTVRFSSLDGELYAHSAFPTDDVDAVFFGPDTYRFAALIRSELEREPLQNAEGKGMRIVDVGCGAGPGGLVAAKCPANAQALLSLVDINASALQFASANAALAGVQASFALGDLYAPVDGEFDLIVSNPPYLIDKSERAYRHGGGEWGGALSERIVREGIERLAPQGRLVLYTGVAIVEGRDPFIESLREELDARGWPWRYRELDPDVFGEELERPAYERAERIAAVSLVVKRNAQ